MSTIGVVCCAGCATVEISYVVGHDSVSYHCVLKVDVSVPVDWSEVVWVGLISSSEVDSLVYGESVLSAVCVVVYHG